MRIYQKRRKTTQKAKTLWTGAEFISNRGTKETQALFDGKTYFDFPKPVELIKRIAEISTSEGDIMLDAFSGSGGADVKIMDRFFRHRQGSALFHLHKHPEITPF
nr:DNA methyltransferase [Leuconostoc mesenteroides]